MHAHRPEDLDRLFAAALNSGDLDALMALYEPQATLTSSPGRTVTGKPAIRDALSGFVAGRPRMSIAPRVMAETGDLALVSAEWSLDMTGADGKPAHISGQSVEVARRQPDGRCLFAIDEPFGTAHP
jgi:uncharacterized protein (TIGR02246 family)